MLCFSKATSLNWDSGLVLRSKIRVPIDEETGHIYVHKSQREKVFFTLSPLSVRLYTVCPKIRTDVQMDNNIMRNNFGTSIFNINHPNCTAPDPSYIARERDHTWRKHHSVIPVFAETIKAVAVSCGFADEFYIQPRLQKTLWKINERIQESYGI